MISKTIEQGSILIIPYPDPFTLICSNNNRRERLEQYCFRTGFEPRILASNWIIKLAITNYCWHFVMCSNANFSISYLLASIS
jgi:hypothetical protein